MGTLGFVTPSPIRPVLASTSFIVDARPGALVESDIFVNRGLSMVGASGGEREPLRSGEHRAHEIRPLQQASGIRASAKRK